MQNEDVIERYIAFCSVMDSVGSQRERMARLTDEQRFAEFEASEQGYEHLWDVRAGNSASRIHAPQVSEGWVEMFGEFDPEHFKDFVTREFRSNPIRTELLNENEIWDEYFGSQFEDRGDDVCFHNDQIIEQRVVARREVGLSGNTIAERFGAYTVVMSSIPAERKRMAGLTEEEQFAEFKASELGSLILAEVRAKHDASNSLTLQLDNVVPDNFEDSLRTDAPESRIDQQKFEAWQGVMCSLQSEQSRMGNLTVDQRRAEYEASQIGPERFQQVRAQHDIINGYGDAKPALPDKGTLDHWVCELTEAANKNRRPLSGSEFKEIVTSIENCSRGADLEKAKAREVTGLLAKVHGPSGESLFRDPELRDAYKSAIAPDRSISQAGVLGNPAPAEQVTDANKRTVSPNRVR